MQLYGSTISPFVRKVMVFAEEKGIAIDLVPVGPGSDHAAFRAASPFGKMPALVDGDFSLADSTAIAVYLDTKYPDMPLIPTSAEGRGRTIWFDEFADTIIFAAGRDMLANRVVGPLFRGQAGDPDQADAAERDAWPPIVAYLNDAIGARSFLVEDRLTLADIAVASAFASSIHGGAPVDADRWPDAARYLAAMLARPAFAHWIERERGFIARARARAGGADTAALGERRD